MKNSKSGLFLIELMICILFFSLMGGICLQIFVKAHTISQSSEELNYAQNLTQSIFSILEEEKFDSEFLQCYPYQNKTEEGYILFFNGNWENCEESKGVYYIEINVDEQNQTRKIKATVKKENNQIEQQKISVHLPYTLEGIKQ